MTFVSVGLWLGALISTRVPGILTTPRSQSTVDAGQKMVVPCVREAGLGNAVLQVGGVVVAMPIAGLGVLTANVTREQRQQTILVELDMEILTAVCGLRGTVVLRAVGVGALMPTVDQAVKAEHVLRTRVADLARFISTPRFLMPPREQQLSSASRRVNIFSLP